MTGRNWRHFSSFWPFMVAGALGPADADSSSELDMESDDVASASSALARRAPRSESGTDGDGSDASEAAGSADVPIELRDMGGAPPGPEAIHSDRYEDVFGEIPLHDAMLEMLCQAAQLGGDFFGDNMADTTIMPEALIVTMDARAKALAVDSLQTLYGHMNTSKVHQVVQHAAEELRGLGNL